MSGTARDAAERICEDTRCKHVMKCAHAGHLEWNGAFEAITAALEERDREIERRDREVKSVLDHIPGAVNVCEGGAEENIYASLAVSVAKQTSEIERLKTQHLGAEIILRRVGEAEQENKAMSAWLERKTREVERVYETHEKQFAELNVKRDTLKSRLDEAVRLLGLVRFDNSIDRGQCVAFLQRVKGGQS